MSKLFGSRAKDTAMQMMGTTKTAAEEYRNAELVKAAAVGVGVGVVERVIAEPDLKTTIQWAGEQAVQQEMAEV